MEDSKQMFEKNAQYVQMPRVHTRHTDNIQHCIVLFILTGTLEIKLNEMKDDRILANDVRLANECIENT